MPHRYIPDADHLEGVIGLLRSLKLPITIEWMHGRNRSLDQNRLQWLWAGEVAAQRGDMTAADVQADWKLRHGVPILRADSESFRVVYDKHLKPLPYWEKLNAIRDLDLGITRAMKVKQMTRYLDAVQRECLEQGFRLTDPAVME